MHGGAADAVQPAAKAGGDARWAARPGAPGPDFPAAGVKLGQVEGRDLAARRFQRAAGAQQQPGAGAVQPLDLAGVDADIALRLDRARSRLPNSRSSRALSAMVQAPPTASVRPSRSSLNQASGSSGNGLDACHKPPQRTWNNAAKAQSSKSSIPPIGYSAGLYTALARMGMAPHALQHQPHRLEVDRHHHLQRHQRIGSSIFSSAPSRQRAARAGKAGMQDGRACFVFLDRDGDALARRRTRNW